MTQEEKELFLRDLCARFPYGVKIKRINCPINLSVTGILGEYVHHTPFYVGGNIEVNTSIIEEVKPYLRSMSSMTEDEKREYNKLLDDCEEQDIADYNITTLVDSMLFFVIDWLNEHHFDYRGLIEKGFALEAPEGMYEIK